MFDYRVIRFEYNNGDVEFQICEVSITQDDSVGELISVYTDGIPKGESLKELKIEVENYVEALSKPIVVWREDKASYIEKE